MPVYKTPENYLREAIESILNQTFTDFEFLILDDCPTDTRKAVVKSYQDPRIKYYQNEVNLGISEARNRLLDLAKGEYLAIFDHDDISLPTRLEKQVSFLDKHPDYGAVSSYCKNIIGNNETRFPCDDADIRVVLMRYCALIHSATMIRKSVLDEHNIRYESKYSPAEDYALFCHLIPYTKFCNLDEVLFWYRNHKGNTSNLQKNKMNQATLAIRKMVETEYPDLYQQYQRYFIVDCKKYKLFGFINLFIIYHAYLYTKVCFLHKKFCLLEIKHIRSYKY